MHVSAVTPFDLSKFPPYSLVQSFPHRTQGLSNAGSGPFHGAVSASAAR